MKKILWSFVVIALLIIPLVARGQSGFGSGWMAQYFNNTSLAGAPVYTETLPNGINFNWGTGSPNTLVPTDNFSARFTSVQNFSEGVYEFVVSSDDGVRVFIDNVLVLDRFVGRVLTTDRFQQTLTGGSHSLIVEYVEFIDQAAIQFQWFLITDPQYITPSPVPPCEPIQPPSASVAEWVGQYFNNTELEGLPVYSDRIVGVLDFEWGLDSPNPLVVVADNFSARFTGTAAFAAATYEFFVASDDGVRVFMDNVLVLDRFYGRVLTTDAFQLPLSAGIHTLTVEYVEFIDQAAIQVTWYPAGQVTSPCGTREPAETFLAENLGNLTNQAITAAGGTSNVGENNEGNSYSRVIAVNGNFVRNPGEIGVAGLIERGVQQAVDVFGLLPGGTSVVPFNAPVRVCLQGEGDVVFLSAADEPRVPILMTSTVENGYSCVDVPNAGTVVLINALESTPEVTPVP